MPGAFVFMSTVGHDLKHGLRVMARHRSFALAAIVTLAIGVGASTAVFTIAYGVLWRPLPFADPDRLVTLSNTIPGAGVGSFPFSQPELFALRADIGAVTGLTAYTPVSLTLTGSGDPERVSGARVSADFFGVLGVTPAIGRAFAGGDDRPGADCVVVASHAYWTTRFAADPGALGRTLVIDDAVCEVTGVLGADVRLPATAELWLPARFPTETMGRDGLGRQSYRLIARLAEGVAPEQAAAAIQETARGFYATYPDFYSGSPWRIEVAPLARQIVGDVSVTLLVLLAAVLGMLGITGANVAHLMLSRVLARDREFAVRLALGGNCAKLFGQVFTECALLSVAGSALGLWLAARAVDVFLAARTTNIPRTESIAVDATAAGFAAAAALVVSLLVGLTPAFRSARGDSAAVLRQARGASHRTRLMRDVLVSAQVALTLVLLVGTLLLARSFDRLTGVDPGIATGDRLVAQISPPRSRYAETAKIAALFSEIASRAAAVPGVRAAGGVSALPLSGQDNRAAFSVEGWTPEQSAQAGSVHFRLVTGAYFQAVGVPLVQGRLPDWSDARDAVPVAVVNRTFAQRFWPAARAIGHRLTFDRGERWYTIAGIVEDVRHFGLEAPTDIEVFLPFEQAASNFTPTMSLVVHTTVAQAAMTTALREQVAALDPGLPLHDIRSMSDVIDASVGRPRFRTGLTAVFAGIGLLLVGLALFTVMAQSAAERAYEIAVHIALGARPGRIVALVVGRAVALTMVGVAVGALAALGVSRSLTTLLYAVGPTDPTAYGAAALLMLVTGGLAAAWPARRAVGLDPVRALRAE